MIFKNINSEDISGLIICSEPPISSSAIRTKETTIDGRDGAIVEKLGYKTRIRNVEIGLKKDANVDKILSYFSGEGDLIFKNENDKVYKAAIYEQVDLERLLRLRKGSVAFYCQPFKYKRNDIFETIKDNKVKEKKGKHLELLNCAEQNVVDLKLEGSTTQDTRSGKNKLPYNYYDGNSKTVNGITFTVNEDKSITANGTATINASFSITNLNNYGIAAGSYKLVGENNAYTKQAIRGSYKKADGTITYIGSATSSFTIPEGATNINIYVVILQGETVNNVTFYPMLLNSTETDLTFEAGGASPSPDYPSPIENVEGNVEIKDVGENLFDKKTNTILTWLTAAEITEKGSVCSKNFIPTTKNKIYATNFAACVFYYDKKLNYLGNSMDLRTDSGNSYTTWTNPDNNSIAFMKVEYRTSNNNLDMTTQEIMLTESETVKVYTPYQEQKVDFPLSEGQKLYEGSYLASDGIHHKRKQVVLDGGKYENWAIWTASLTNVERFYINLEKPAKYNGASLCSHFRLSSADSDTEHFRWSTSSGMQKQFVIFIDKSKATTVAELKTWLQSNPITVEYELSEEEIVPYTTAQQEAYNQLQKLKLYKGQNTMFSLEGSIINLKYLEDTDEKVENQGNIYSKPIIRLEKTVFKEVEIAINGIRFKYNFEEDDYVEIDCEEMTVQYEGLDRNRRLVIDFEFPKLKEGNNDIIMYDGDCIIKCKRKDRWL
jgi:predicted phage tail component-like protein